MRGGRKRWARIAGVLGLAFAATLSTGARRPVEPLQAEPPKLTPKGMVEINALYKGGRYYTFTLPVRYVSVVLRACDDVPRGRFGGGERGIAVAEAYEIAVVTDKHDLSHNPQTRINAMFFCDQVYRVSPNGLLLARRLAWADACMFVGVRTTMRVRFTAATQPGDLASVPGLCAAAMADPARGRLPSEYDDPTAKRWLPALK